MGFLGQGRGARLKRLALVLLAVAAYIGLAYLVLLVVPPEVGTLAVLLLVLAPFGALFVIRALKLNPRKGWRRRSVPPPDDAPQ